MSKPITISLENLNSLYFKFLNQFVLQYLPKDIYNQVVSLLSLKSAVQTYRFLDRLVTGNDERKFGTTGDDKKAKIQGNERNENQKWTETYQEKSVKSNQGTISYTEKDDDKYPNQPATIKKPPTLLKRTHTYQSPQKPSTINYESYNLGQARLSKQDASLNKNTNNKQHSVSVKYPLNSISPILNINVVKHDYDTVSQKHNLVGVSTNKRESSSNKDREEIRSAVNGVSDIYSLNGSKQKVSSKEKSEQNLSANNNGSKKTQFSKTYSIRESEGKAVGVFPNIVNSISNNNTPTVPSVINRLRFQNLISQTKEMFNQNAKKIARYEKISTDLGQKQQQQNSQHSAEQKNQKYASMSGGNANSDNSASPFSPESGSSYTYMYKKY